MAISLPAAILASPAQDHISKVLPRRMGDHRLVAYEPIPLPKKNRFEAVALEGKAALKTAQKVPIGWAHKGDSSCINSAWWQAAFDEKSLYVRVRVNMKDADLVKATAKDIAAGDFVTIWPNPIPRDELRFRFSANPLAMHYDSYQDDLSWNTAWQSSGLVDARGWEVTFTIPYTSFKDAAGKAKYGCWTSSFAINAAVHVGDNIITCNGQWDQPRKFGLLHRGRPDKPEITKISLSMWTDRKTYDALDLTAQAFIQGEVGFPIGADLKMRILSGDDPVWSRTIRVKQDDTSAALVLDLRDMKPGNYTLTATLGRDDKELGRAEAALKMVDLAPGKRKPAALSGTIPILVQPNAKAAGSRPLTCGVPIPRGVMLTDKKIRLLRPDGREASLQSKVTARWSPRGYVKWILIDFPGRVDSNKVTQYTLEYGPDVKRGRPAKPVTLTRANGQITVNTGPLEFTVKERGFSFLESAKLTGEELISGSRLTLTDEHGTVYQASNDLNSEVTIEEAGPLRVVLAAKGWFVDKKKKVGRYVVRIHAYRGQRHVRVFHTFIITEETKKLRYRNIALESTLTQKGKMIFGLEKGKPVSMSGDNAYLVQDSYNEGRLIGGDRRIKLTERKRSAGWVDTGRVTVSVRDMWQNFPKELEVEGNALRVHFWPRHSTPVSHPPDTIDEHNVHMLWFAHEGRNLDFSIPKSYSNLYTKGQSPGSEFDYVANVTRDDSDEALGVAKTHEMLWHFQAPAQTGRHAAEAFSQDIGCLPSPKWIGETKAAGHLHPVDTARFPRVELGLSTFFDWKRSSGAFTHDYGMWNFGDFHTRLVHDKKRTRWEVHRTWNNHHYGIPRQPWLLYMRSGDVKYLEWARRSNLHHMDVDICHYSTPEYKAKGYPHGKIPGALTDYKGLVHWHSGNRLYDYNSCVDYLFYDYYLTGQQRSIDVAKETADAFARIGQSPGIGRDGEGPASTFAFLYAATFDARLLPRVYAWADKLMSCQAEDGSMLPDRWFSFAPWLTRYCDLTRDPRGYRVLEKWADFAAGDVNRQYLNVWDVLAEGYRQFGKIEYLRKGQAAMDMVFECQLLQPGHFLHGHITDKPEIVGGYCAMQTPDFLDALAFATGDIEPLYDITWIGNDSKLTVTIHNGYLQKPMPVSIMREDVDKAFTVNLEGEFKKKDESQMDAWITRGDTGKEVARTKLAIRGSTKMNVPADGVAAEYIVWIGTTDNVFSYLTFPISDLPKEVITWGPLRYRFMQALYFMPKPGASEALMGVTGGREYSGHAVRRPDGSIVAEASSTEYVEMPFTIAPELKGELLHWTHGRSHAAVSSPREGLVPWLSLSPEKYFMPKWQVGE